MSISRRLAPLFLSALLFGVVPERARAGCLFWFRNALNALTNHERRKPAVELRAFLAAPSEYLPLSTLEIEQLTLYAHGFHQDLFLIPKSDSLIKIPRWRKNFDPRSPDTFKDLSQRVIADFPDRREFEAKYSHLFPPSIHGATADGFPFTIQKKAQIPKTFLGRLKALREVIAELRKISPTLHYDKDDAFVFFKIGNTGYKIGDLRSFNVGYSEGRPVIVDCNLFVSRFPPKNDAIEK